MFKNLFTVLVVVLLTLFATAVFASEGCGGGGEQHNCATCHTLSEKEANQIFKQIGGTVKSIKDAPAKGMFELLMEKDGKQGIIFLDYGKKHLIQGTIIDIATLQPVIAHKDLLPKQVTSVDVTTIPVENAVIMGNPKGSKKLYIFTDPDCPYCRKGHVELQKLAKIAPDVAIHIMLFPLPMHPGAYDKSRAIFESKSLEQLDNAFDGKEIAKPAKEASKAAIDANIKFGNKNGITGTPTMIMPNGKVEVGLRDAETLKKMLE